MTSLCSSGCNTVYFWGQKIFLLSLSWNTLLAGDSDWSWSPVPRCWCRTPHSPQLVFPRPAAHTGVFLNLSGNWGRERWSAHPQSRLKNLWQEYRAGGSQPAFGCQVQEPGASAGWMLATRGERATRWQWLGVRDQAGAHSWAFSALERNTGRKYRLQRPIILPNKQKGT